MRPKRTIRAKDVVNDIRAGLNDAELMGKYKVSAQGLARIFTKLIEARAVRPGELEGRFPYLDDTVNVENLRKSVRNYVVFPLPIYEVGRLEVEGTLRDVSEHGLQVAGIECAVNETKEFLVRADEFHDVFPFVFQATCRWVGGGGGGSESAAGFEITEISDRAHEQLRAIIRVLTFPDKESPFAPVRASSAPVNA